MKKILEMFKKYDIIILLASLVIFASSISVNGQARVSKTKNTDETRQTKRILFLGNSLSAGLGVAPEQAFPALIQQKIDSLGWQFQVINAGLSGETSAGGMRRLNWLLKRKIDVLVLELGANDGLRGHSPKLTEENLQEIIRRAKKKYPDVQILIAGMEALPNMGDVFVKEFRAIFPRLAQKNDAALIPFLLENVAGKPELNQADGVHPNPAGHKIVAENVWKILKPELEKIRQASVSGKSNNR